MINQINTAVIRRIRKDSEPPSYRLAIQEHDAVTLPQWSMHPEQRAHLHLPCDSAAWPLYRLHTSNTTIQPQATGSKCVFPLNSTANVSHVECRCTHVEDILPVNANRAARSFRQMICQSVISRDPPEIRSADAIMTNGSPLPRPALCSPGSRARWTKNSFEGLLSGEESTAWYGEAHEELV